MERQNRVLSIGEKLRSGLLRLQIQDSGTEETGVYWLFAAKAAAHNMQALCRHEPAQPLPH
jgi:hypothetical protein